MRRVRVYRLRDINSLNERLDELETGQIASIEDQIAALTGSLDEAEELIKMLQGNVSDLEAADDAMGQQIEAINGEIENVKADITDLGGQITDINGKISDVQNELSKKIDDAVAELEAADDYNADKIAALTQDLSDAKEELKGLIAQAQTALEELIKAGDDANAQAIKDAQSKLEELIASGDAENKAAIEEVRNELKELLDQHTADILDITAKIADINDRIAKLEEKVDGYYEELTTSISNLSARLDEANADNAAKFAEIAGQIKELSGKYDELKARHEELRSEFDVQVEKLAALEGTVAELTAAVTALQELTADLPALESLVDSIKTNYLSKEEAHSTYATIENVALLEESLGKLEGRVELLESLNIGERLTELETKYDDLEGVVIPGLKDAINKAQTTADNAVDMAEDAMDFAEGVLGELEMLKEALGVYAEKGALEAQIDALLMADAELAKADAAIREEISALETRLMAQVAEINNSIATLRSDLDKAVEEIYATMVSQEQFASLFERELGKALANDGAITEAITKAIEEARLELQGDIDAVKAKIEGLMFAIENINVRLSDVEDDIEDLEDRIQSLVFVPEYNDGKATVLSYTINGTPVSDNMVVTATFQVTPAALAENVINQYENVLVKVLPVLTRSASDAAFIASVQDGTLAIEKGKGAGYIDVEVTVPVKTEDGTELKPGAFAISLYVASKEEVEAAVNGMADIDAGTYVSSDYVQTYGAEATEIANAYVLYNEKAAEVKEYPAGADDFVKDVNSYEVAWSVLNRKVSLYGDNNYDDVDDGTYTLHIKLGDEYYTLEEAAEMMRAEVEEITPDYGYSPVYYDRYDMPADIAEYFELEEEDPYGLSIDMAKESAMTDVIGSYVFAYNTFSFGADSRYGAVTVLNNVGKYKVINLPITVDIAASRIDWSYDFALAHANNSENPQVPNIQPIVSTQAYVAENLGEISLADILKLTPSKTEVRLGDSDEPLSSTEAPVITFSDATAETDTTGSIGISVINYGFSSSAENVYNFSNTYYIEEYDVECTVNFTLTLGQMPGDQFVNYGKPVDIEFLLTNSANIGVDNGYTKAFKQLNQMNPEWFADEAQLTESMQAAANLTTYSTYKDGDVLYENAQHSDQSPVYTRLSIEPTNEYPEGSYIRVSSSAITAVGNEFNFVTAVDTWYGVTYTFTHSGKVAAPEYGLSYIPTHLFDYGTENPYVQLDYHLNAAGKAYVIDEANLRNYFEVTNIPDGFTGELTVKFEVLTQENPAEGYVNIPSINTLLVDNTNGQLEEYPIDWTTYTARDIQIRATLVASADASTTKEIEINSLDLAIRVYPLVESADMKGTDDLDYYGNNYVMDGEYIVVSREGGETININLWEYVEAYARFSNGENFIPYENAQGVRHTSLGYVNDNPAMMLYGAELVFYDNIDAVSGGLRRDIGYDCNTGIVTYKAEDGEIANPIYITVEGQLNYYLDYNHVQSYPVKVMIKLQDAE